MPSPRPALVAALVALGLACGPQAGETTAVFTTVPPTSSTGDDPSTGEPGSTSAATNATTTSTSSDASTSAAEPTSTSTSDVSASVASTASTFDVGTDKDLGPPTPVGCKGKIDFLFIVSGSPVMKDAQAQLVASFPAFIETIAAKFEDFDYHVMAVDARAPWGVEHCTSDCPVLDCSEGQPCCLTPDYPCGLLDLVTACDNTLGAGSVFPAGQGASNELCPIAEGRRFMRKGQPDLAETFACAARIGLTGGVQIGSALVAAVGPILNGPGGCNEGFLRDDALLMVTLVTPGGDQGSKGTPESWAKAVIKAKNNDPEAVVMFVIGNDACPDYDEPCQMALTFPYHYISNSNDKDYGPAFDAASDLAFEACELLVPG